MNIDTNELELNTAVLVGVNTPKTERFEDSMEELERLAEALNCEVVGVLTQELPNPNPGTYLGTGKLKELADYVSNLEADYCIFLDTLSPAQLKNVTAEVDCIVYDRTGLILEIFSRRVRTKEAKLQVESANLQYMLPRLIGMRTSLGRQAGASGSMSNKGQGEKQLELDRRHIEKRLAELRRSLEDIESNRDVQRKARKKSNLPSVALVGYTNAGKSTLMNCLLNYNYSKADASGPELNAAPYLSDDTGNVADGYKDLSNENSYNSNNTNSHKQVFVKDMLFATLDTSVRRISTGDNKDFLLSDTVGFVSNLPHGLIKAFRSTLDEVRYADILLIVADASDSACSDQIRITTDTLKELGATDIPRIIVMNKCDKLTDSDTNVSLYDNNNQRIFISAKNGQGIDKLISAIKNEVYGDNELVDITIPYSKGSLLSLLNENAHIISQDYEADGTHIIADCPAWLAGKIKVELS